MKPVTRRWIRRIIAILIGLTLGYIAADLYFGAKPVM